MLCVCAFARQLSPGRGQKREMFAYKWPNDFSLLSFSKARKGEEEKGIPGIAEIFSPLLSYAADASNSGNPSFCFRVWEFLGPSAKIPSSLGSASVLLLSILEFCGGGFSTHYSFPPCDVSSFFPCCWHDRTPLRRRKRGGRGRGRNCGFSTLSQERRRGENRRQENEGQETKIRPQFCSGSSSFPGKSRKKN